MREMMDVTPESSPNPYGVGLSAIERTRMQLDTWIDAVLEDLDLL